MGVSSLARELAAERLHLRDGVARARQSRLMMRAKSCAFKFVPNAPMLSSKHVRRCRRGHYPFAALSLKQIEGACHVGRACCVHLSVKAGPHAPTFILGLPPPAL